jgi:hypothetical protein
MPISIKDIAGHIGKFNPIYKDLNHPEARIEKIQSLRPGIINPGRDVLYIGAVSALPLLSPASFICIEDVPVSALEHSYDNLIVLPAGTDLSEVYSELCSFLLMHDQAFQNAESLLQSLAKAEGLNDIVNIGYRMLENPLIISDKGWKALAMTGDVDIPDDTGWNEFKSMGALSFETVSADIESKLTDRIEQSRRPFCWQDAHMRYPRLFGKVAIGTRPVATVSVIEYNRPFSERDYMLLPLLCSAVSAEMQKNKLYLTGGLLYEKFIEDLLDGKPGGSDSFDEKVKALNWIRKKLLYVLAIDIKGFDSEHFSVSYLRDYLEKMISGSMAVVYRDTIIIITSCDREKELYGFTMDTLSVFLKKYNIRCGLSRPFTDLMKLREHYVQSLEALHLGTAMDSKSFIYSYEDYAVYHIARVCQMNTSLSFFCHPKLQSLLDYDRAHKSAFSKSLYAYLKNSRNITKTANALNLHRNSMIYHLKRIEEILDISLMDNDILFQLELSCRFLEYDMLMNGKQIE